MEREIIQGKVYIKESDDALEKRKEFLELSINAYKSELQEVEAKIKAQIAQKAEIQRKQQIIADLEKEAVEFNANDSVETLEKLLPQRGAEVIPEEVTVERL